MPVQARDTCGTLIRRNFVGKKTDISRREETLSGAAQKTADVDEQLHLFANMLHIREKDPRSFQVARDTVDGDSSRGGARRPRLGI